MWSKYFLQQSRRAASVVSYTATFDIANHTSQAHSSAAIIRIRLTVRRELSASSARAQREKGVGIGYLLNLA
jgi:hypothetical protein